MLGGSLDPGGGKDHIPYNSKDKSHFFCSELLAHLFQQLGLLPKHIWGENGPNDPPADKANCYLPEHFIKGGLVDQYMDEHTKGRKTIFGDLTKLCMPMVRSRPKNKVSY